jgi:hypothetical protein
LSIIRRGLLRNENNNSRIQGRESEIIEGFQMRDPGPLPRDTPASFGTDPIRRY